MAGKIKIISGVDDSNNSIKLDKQFKIELTNDESIRWYSKINTYTVLY